MKPSKFSGGPKEHDLDPKDSMYATIYPIKKYIFAYCNVRTIPQAYKEMEKSHSIHKIVYDYRRKYKSRPLEHIEHILIYSNTHLSIVRRFC